MGREPESTPGLFSVFLIDGVNIGGIVAISSDESSLSNTVVGGTDEMSGVGASASNDVEVDCPLNTGNASLSSEEISSLESLEGPPIFLGEML